MVLKKLTNIKNNNNSGNYSQNLTHAKTTTTTLPKFNHEEHVEFESTHERMPVKRTGLLEKRKMNDQQSVRLNPTRVGNELNDYYDIRFNPSSSFKSNYKSIDPRKSTSYAAHKFSQQPMNVSLASRRSSTKSGFTYLKNMSSSDNFDNHLNLSNNQTSIKSIPYHRVTLSDLCPEPKRLNMVAFLSPESQYSIIKSYEDLMVEELSRAYPNEDTLPKSKSPRDESVKTPSLDSRQSKTHFFKHPNSNENANNDNDDDLMKHKVSHFIEAAMKTLDNVRKNKKHNPTLNDDHSLFTTHGQNSLDNININQSGYMIPSASLYDFEHPLDMYSIWVDLLNEEFIQ